MRKAYFDGSSLDNPGHAGAAYVLVENGQVIEERGAYIGEMSNNQAEYRAALAAVRAAVNRGWKVFELVGDSQLVINQLKGEWKVKDESLRVPHAKLLALIQEKGLTVRFVWVPREENARANELAQAASKRGKTESSNSSPVGDVGSMEKVEVIEQPVAQPEPQAEKPATAEQTVVEEMEQAEQGSQSGGRLSIAALTQMGAEMSPEEAAAIDAAAETAMKANDEEDATMKDEIMNPELQETADAMIEAVAEMTNNPTNTALIQDTESIKKRGTRVEMTIDVSDPFVVRAGYGFVVTGDLANAIRNGQVVDLTLVDSQHGQQVKMILDTRNLNVEAASKRGSFALVAATNVLECEILDMLAFANRDQHEQGIYVESVPSLFTMVKRRFNKDAMMEQWETMRHTLRDARTFGLYGKGSVLPTLSNKASINAVQLSDGRLILLGVEVAIGDRLLAEMARRMGLDFGDGGDLELAKIMAVAINDGLVPMVLTRNPHTSITLGFVRVDKVYVVPNSSGIFFAPDVAKAFFGDFDGDTYFVFPSKRRLAEELKCIIEGKALKAERVRAAAERQPIWERIRETFNSRIADIKKIEDESERRAALEALKAEIAEDVAKMKAITPEEMTVLRAIARTDVVMEAKFTTEPDQFKVHDQVNLDNFVNPEKTQGKKKLNTSVFNGILPVAGADARKYVGILHAAVVGLIGTVYKYIDATTAQMVGDTLLEVFETLFDAGKESSNIGRVAHGLPFVSTLSEMLYSSSTRGYASLMLRLADEFCEFNNNPNDATAAAIRTCAERMLEQQNAQIGTVTETMTISRTRKAGKELVVENVEIPARIDTTATNLLEGNLRRMVMDPESFGRYLNNELDSAEAVNLFGEEQLIRPQIPKAEELDLSDDDMHLRAAIAEAYSEYLYKGLPRAARYNISKDNRLIYRVAPKAIEPKNEKEARRRAFRGVGTKGEKLIDYELEFINPNDIEFVMVVDESKLTADMKTSLVDAVVRLKDGKRADDGNYRFKSLQAAIGAGLVPEHGRPAYVVVAKKKNGKFAIALYVQMLSIGPNGSNVNSKHYDTAYMPALVIDDVEVIKKLSGKDDAGKDKVLVMAVRLKMDGSEYVVPGRICTRAATYYEDVGKNFAIQRVRFEPCFQDPFIAIAQYMLEAYRDSHFSVSAVERFGEGEKEQVVVTRPVLAHRYTDFNRALKRAVVKQFSRIHKIEGFNQDEVNEQVGYASHFILIDETLLKLIRERIVGLVHIEEGKYRSVVLPYQPGLAFVGEDGLPGLDEVINSVISHDGNRRRIYLPLKKDGSRILWFDPASREELAEMCIPVVDTNFRRQVREQLPFSTLWIREVVDGKPVMMREIKMRVLFANADWLTTSKNESVEGMLILRDLNLLVSKTVVFKVQPDLSLAEQVRQVHQREFRYAQYLVNEQGKYVKLEDALADETKLLQCVRVREETFDIGNSTFTHKSATVRFGYYGMPDIVKLMFREGTIKGMASRVYDDLYAVLGPYRYKVDVVAPMAAIVEKNTASIMIYGLAMLLGRQDIIEEYEAEILRIRQEFNDRISDEGQEERKAAEQRARAVAVEKIRQAAKDAGIDNIEDADVVLVREDGEHHIGKGLLLELTVRVLDTTSITNGRAGYVGNSLLQREVIMVARDAIKEQAEKETNADDREKLEQVYKFYAEIARAMRPIQPVREHLVSQLSSFVENVKLMQDQLGDNNSR